MICKRSLTRISHPKHFPKIIAHRGFCRQHIEDTIPALKAAVAAKAEMIEADVHETRDGYFIVHHDNSLNHDTPSWADLTYTQVRNLTARNGQAPRLSDCLRAIGSMPVDLEIKSYVNVSNLVRELEASPPSQGSVVSSFDYYLLKRLHARGVSLPLILIVAISSRRSLEQNIRNAYLCLAPQLTPKFLDGVAVHYNLAYKHLIKCLQSKGSTVFVWTVDEFARMKKFISWGVDGIITNYPDRLLEVIQSLRDSI
jgi:glycerophosphoryl diester phosphodiesterase